VTTLHFLYFKTTSNKIAKIFHPKHVQKMPRRKRGKTNRKNAFTEIGSFSVSKTGMGLISPQGSTHSCSKEREKMK